jgi:hypothetical protein
MGVNKLKTARDCVNSPKNMKNILQSLWAILTYTMPIPDAYDNESEMNSIDFSNQGL